jgi:translation initiation factor 5B
VTTIRALLTPPHMQELRVKSEYVHHKTVKAAMGVKISAQGLEHAIAGSQLLVYRQNRGPSIEELKDEVQGDLATILSKVDKSGQGVCVQASTLGSLEALLTFLGDMKVSEDNTTRGMGAR